jgi:hypothetical protein
LTASSLAHLRRLAYRFIGLAIAFVAAAGLLIGPGPSTAVAAPVPSTLAAHAVTSAPMVVLVASSNGANPGTCPTHNTTSFAKTKFVLHLGLAFGAFHRYLYKPFRAGSFSHGAHGRFTTFIKAGLAAAFMEHEVRLAAGDVQANPTLCKVIAAPMRSLFSSLGGVVSGLRHGDTSVVQNAQKNLGSIESSAAAQGSKIVESANPSIG